MPTLPGHHPDPEPAVPARPAIDLGAIRQRLAHTPGRQLWRSLEELADTEEFQAYLRAEFPHAWRADDAVSRRQFLQLMAASLALAGVSACTRQPEERIFPYVKAPEEIVPGEPLFFATAMPLAGVGVGLLVESHMGRPTKVEGNAEHPASLGATDVFGQASVLTLYDPDRSQVVTHVGDIRPWSAVTATLREAFQAQQPRRGAGLRILSGSVTSPTLAAQLQQVLAALPDARWYQYEAVNRDNVRVGARLAFGGDVDTYYRYDRARVILSLDADFLMDGPARLRATRDFSRARRVAGGRAEMTRLYVVETALSNTGAMADHRLPLRPDEIEKMARAVAARLGLAVEAPGDVDRHAGWIDAVVQDLQQHRGESVVVAGDFQPPAVHALAHAINHTLRNNGQTVVYTDPVDAAPTEHVASLRELTEAMGAGAVEVLLILGGNPVLTAPVDLRFAERMSTVGLRVHLGLYQDETAELCHWHVPEAHYLESWSDVRAYDGSVSIMQPLIAPLYDGKTAHEVVSAFIEPSPRSSYDIVRAHWQRQRRGARFEEFWRRAVHDGVVADSAFTPKQIGLKPNWGAGITGQRSVASAELPPPAPGTLDLIFRPDPSLFDGSFANNAWLQELPRPITKLTWDNAALIAPRTAERLGVANEDVLEIDCGGRSVRAPAWIVPGQAPETIVVHLGHGRVRAGRVANGSGFNAYKLRTSDGLWYARGVRTTRTGARHALACTQHQHAMEGREPVRVGTLEQYRQDPDFVRAGGHDTGNQPSLHPPFAYTGYAWGMTIDLNACTGCNACVVACQAENNIAVVGKADVAVGRQMHWIRIDRYYAGDLDNPGTYQQPVFCMHCERAPCEVVCPVNATVHSDEGLNEMVYNRCVGTRYCSNNCPYKVRRFNFRLYSNWHTETLKMQRNPDVTVRSRGVMEKCTYCVQRINHARIQAKREDRSIRDGEVVTACQAVCPAEAIVFGNINDGASEVAQRKAEPRNYGLLEEVGTQPRTTYLARLRNPNPVLERGET